MLTVPCSAASNAETALTKQSTGRKVRRTKLYGHTIASKYFICDGIPHNTRQYCSNKTRTILAAARGGKEPVSGNLAQETCCKMIA